MATIAATAPFDETPEHPLYARQVQLEREMLEIGREDYLKSVQKAREKGHLTTLRPYQRFLQELTPKMAEGIRSWRRHAMQVRGVRPIALEYIEDADAELLALIALRSVLNDLGNGFVRVFSLAATIGTAVEHELKCRAWEAQSPGSFKLTQRYFDTEGSTPKHRARGNVALFTQAVRDFGVHWVNWSRDAHFRVGVQLIDILVVYSGLFTVEADPDAALREHRSPPLILSAKPKFLEWLAEGLNKGEEQHPHFYPTIIPPKPWTNTQDGAYWTPYVKTPRLIRFKAHQEEVRDKANDEYDALAMPHVYRAVNNLQAVPWRVDKAVLSIAERCWALDTQIGGLPALSGPPDIPKPQGFEESEAIQKDWRREQRHVKRARNSLGGRMKATKGIISTAQYFSEYDEVYFPHMLDFRGRFYPTTGLFSPQGRDLARGMMTFATGMPIQRENKGDYWLAIQVANMMGHDKVPMEERVDWVLERRDDWKAVLKDPIGNHRIWSTSSKPWQSLQAILDWGHFLDYGFGYRSSLPIMADGTCNGLQHLSALIRDEEAAPLVNLVPGDRPFDIYAKAAKLWQADLEALVKGGGEEGQKAEAFLRWAGGNLPRSSTKRQVMVLPYGGTREAFFTYTRKWLDEVHPLPRFPKPTNQEVEFRNAVLSLVTLRLHKIVGELLPGAMAVMKWLQDCARLVAEGNQPIYWEVPCSGFVVRHFYGKQVAKKVNIRMEGVSYSLKSWETSKDLDLKAQTQGVPPNFIHSLDAAALAETINRCHEAGITSIAAIHDAYGTHAGNMDALSNILREAFVAVHEANPLELFWDGCKDILAGMMMARGVASEDIALELAESQRPPLPEVGKLDLRKGVLHSDYFFS